MRIIERNHVRVFGKGVQPMMFAHGFGCDQNMWRFVTPAFEDSYRIVLFDYVGCGRSDLSAYDRARYSSLEGYAADVLEICEALDLQEIVFVGHSVSSMIGVLASIRQPERFAALVLVGPSPRYVDDEDYSGGFSREQIESMIESLDDNYLGWSRATAPVIMGNPERPELADELTNSFCRTDPAIAQQFARVTFLSDSRADLHKVRVPTLVLQTSVDVIAPPHVGEYVRRHLPNSRLVMLEATGHCPNLSAPDEVVVAMKRFLAGRQADAHPVT